MTRNIILKNDLLNSGNAVNTASLLLYVTSTRKRSKMSNRKQPEICPTCGQVIKKTRSIDISDHFHAHVTETARKTGMSRDYVYHMALLVACEIEVDGGDDYPHVIINDVLYPNPTHTCTNKQMITAVEAIHMLAAHWGIFLTEKEGAA